MEVIIMLRNYDKQDLLVEAIFWWLVRQVRGRYVDYKNKKALSKELKDLYDDDDWD
jgi:hypothetical protein